MLHCIHNFALALGGVNVWIKLTGRRSGASRRGDRGSVGPAQAQQRGHAAPSLGAAALHGAALALGPLSLVLGARHKLIRLVDHHALRERKRARERV